MCHYTRWWGHLQFSCWDVGTALVWCSSLKICSKREVKLGQRTFGYMLFHCDLDFTYIFAPCCLLHLSVPRSVCAHYNYRNGKRGGWVYICWLNAEIELEQNRKKNDKRGWDELPCKINAQIWSNLIWDFCFFLLGIFFKYDQNRILRKRFEFYLNSNHNNFHY